MQFAECVLQPLGVLEFSYGVSEFHCAGHRCRRRAGAAHGIDQVVVAQHRTRGQYHLAVGHVDPFGGVNDQLDAVAKKRAVVDGGGTGPSDELV